MPTTTAPAPITATVGNGARIHLAAPDRFTNKLYPLCGQAPLRAYVSPAQGPVTCTKCAAQA